MQKYGLIELLEANEKLFIVWSTNGTDFERIDVIEDLEFYDFVDTSNCVASYYRKRKELYLGDRDIITKILHVKNTAVMCHAKVEQTVDIKEDKVVITQNKELKDLGIRYSLVTENGIITQEIYEADNARVTIFETSTEKGLDIEPINISMYQANSVSDYIVDLNQGVADFYSLSYLKAKYPLEHIEDMDMIVAQDFLTGDRRLKEFAESPEKIKAIDIEATGLGVGIFEPDCITGLSIAQDENTSTYYPFRQEACEFNFPIQYLEKILDVINNQPEDTLILAYNATMEYKGIWKEEACYIKDSDYAKKWNSNYIEDAPKNLYLRVDRDPFILSTLVDPFMRKGLHTLKNRALEARGVFFLELKHIFRGEIKFNALPPELIRYYACPDTPNTIAVYKYLLEKLPKDELNIFKLESDIVYLTAIKEFYGMRTNESLLVEKLENEEFKVNKLSQQFKDIHKISSNINSPEVRRDIFYNKLRCPVEVRTKTGLPSTSAVALKRLVQLGTLRNVDPDKKVPPIVDLFGKEIVKGDDLKSNKYPSLVILQAYAKSTKELGAYKRIQRKSVRGRVKFNMNQTGAGSGRETSDAHQYSDGMKQLVMSDSPDHYLWSCDWKQVELRILAFLAQQEDLIELESDMSVDVHRAILSIINKMPIYKISDAMRKDGKSTNFGVVYMMSEYGLALKKHGPAYTKDDVLEAKKSIVDFYNGLPLVKAFVKHNEDFLREYGFVKTMMGRYRYFPRLLDPTVSEKEKKGDIRAGNNSFVQGFGADLLKLAQRAVGQYIHNKGWDEKVDCGGVMLPKVRLMLTIHDEMLVSSHKSIPIEEIIKMFKYCMEIDIDGAPPFFAAPALINNWYDGKKDAYEIDLDFRDKIIEAWDKDKTSLLHVDTYLDDLNNFRKAKLEDYMEDLIKTYKTVDAIAEHVTHNELTHTLISVFVKKEEHLEHEVAIRTAVARYMEQRNQDNVSMYNVKESDTEDQQYYEETIETAEDLGKYVYFDDNGEVIEDVDDVFDGDEEDDDETIIRLDIEASKPVEQENIVYLLDKVIIDLTDVYREDSQKAENINQKIAKLCNKKEYYKVVYLINEQFLDTGLMIGYCPEKIDNIIKGIEGGETLAG